MSLIFTLIFYTFFVVPGRVELPTSTLSVWRSNQLSYRTGRKLSARALSVVRVPGFIFLLFLILNKTFARSKRG